MKREWSERGILTENKLSQKIKEINHFGMNSEKVYYVAFFSDSFFSDFFTDETLDKIEWSHLLEIRIFSEEKEFLANRSAIGEKNLFQWRVASEADMEAERDYFVRFQVLDIDKKKSDFLTHQMMSTGGGKYILPVDENENFVRVISYIGYDEEGMAYIYDNRLAGFRASNKEDN